MDLTGVYPFSLIRSGLLFQNPKLQDNISSEVAIIGGGISGAPAAHTLTEAGIECLLLDGRTIGLGSSCVSTSLLQYELDTPLHQLIEGVGEGKAVRAYQLCGFHRYFNGHQGPTPKHRIPITRWVLEVMESLLV